ncbi:MAG TPA: response regulator [Elusimicrobiota bacterium]|jgi:DNA-binding response OmpR family regulator|nr:response regulator [Elusimicrobiota bacterium]
MARILAVDDEEPILLIVKRLLTLHGYAVDTAADGAAAVDQLQKKHYDLMIIDLVMPRMSGLDAVAIVRSSPKFKSLKILMVTHTSVTKDVDAAYHAGIDGYVVKPFDIQQLLEKIERTLGK